MLGETLPAACMTARLYDSYCKGAAVSPEHENESGRETKMIATRTDGHFEFFRLLSPHSLPRAAHRKPKCRSLMRRVSLSGIFCWIAAMVALVAVAQAADAAEEQLSGKPLVGPRVGMQLSQIDLDDFRGRR